MAKTNSYDRLMSPMTVGNVTMKNRIVKPAASSRFWDTYGIVNDHDRTWAYYEMLAKGHPGMIVFEVLNFMPNDYQKIGDMYSDEFIPGVKGVVDMIHSYDVPTVCLLHHAGPQDPKDPVGPSSLDYDELPYGPETGFKPVRGQSKEEIKDFIAHYIAAAVRCQKAGFDGVEVQACHGYWGQSYISRIFNRRDDEYGAQNVENRTRVQKEIIEGIREQCGPDFLVGIRINSEEFGAGDLGNTIPEMVEVSRALESYGYQYISASGEGYGKVAYMPLYLPSDYWPYPAPDPWMEKYVDRFKGLGMHVPAADAIKKAVNVPVFVVGRLDEDKGEEILEKGMADAICLNRTLFADPMMPEKIRTGQIDRRKRCTRCGTCEDGNNARRCRFNPAFGRYDMDIVPTMGKKKKVVVVGAGPAGMEAAVCACGRGHEVVIYDSEKQLGGHLYLGAMIKGTDFDNFLPVVEFFVNEVNRLPITQKLGKTVDRKTIEREKPDVVILANGGQYRRPNIPGVNGSNVTDVPSLQKLANVPLRMFGPKALHKLTEIALPGIGKRVCIIGGSTAGIQGATFMHKRGKKVTVLEETDMVAKGMPRRYSARVLPWLEREGVPVISSVKIENITSAGVEYVKDGVRKTVECDTVMLLPRLSPNHDLQEQIEGLVPEVYSVGAANGEDEMLIVDALAGARKVCVDL